MQAVFGISGPVPLPVEVSVTSSPGIDIRLAQRHQNILPAQQEYKQAHMLCLHKLA